MQCHYHKMLYMRSFDVFYAFIEISSFNMTLFINFVVCYAKWKIACVEHGMVISTKDFTHNIVKLSS